MEKRWTSAQQAAIDTRDRTLLVSAAAGSGKTATLTERIIRSLTDPEHPSHIEDMLIVTFTRAAASELRARIFSALTDALAQNPSSRHLTDQLMKLGSARICTIDSFYLELLRANFSRLGLSPNFRIADTAEVDVLASAVMNETIDYFYENDPEFPLFAECFSGIRSQDGLANVLLNLDTACASFPEGIAFLKTSAEQTEAEASLDFFKTQFGQVFRRNVADFARYLCDVFSAACEHIASVEAYGKPYGESFAYLRDFSYSLFAIMENSECAYEEAQALLATYDRPAIGRLPKSVEATEELVLYKTLRTDLDKKIKKLAGSTFAKSSATIARTMHDTARHANKLYEVLCEYETRMAHEKQERNFLDFSDIRRYTLKLLIGEDGTPTDVARAYAKTFSHIYIDEYQDVDRVQDTIFSAISRPDNRFMVGDIKQSIYGFRGAEPHVFAEYREAFPAYEARTEQDTSATIFMSNNFRCDKTVIDFTNAVCSYLFSFCADSIGYCPEDDLVFSKALPHDDYHAPKVTLSVLLPPEKEDLSAEDDEDGDDESTISVRYDKKQAEAAYIAREIARLIRHEKKADGSPIVAGDVAVLSRTRAMSAYVAKELQALGIATSDGGKDRYFEDPDVLMMLCLLNAIDNPHRDIPMAGTLRSPIFGFSLDDLVVLRRAAEPSMSLYDAVVLGQNLDTPLGARCRRFCDTLDVWRDRATSLPVDRLLREILDSEIFLSSGLCTQPSDTRGGNLLLLYEYARRFEGSSFKGLYNFIEFINTMMEEGRKLDTPSVSITPDRVSLMTIHQSKGLEFPVCFVCGTGGKFNKTEERESLLFDHPLGVAMKIADGTGFGRINTPMREAILQSCSRKNTEEEMRVLYVALTRARERLYVTGTASKEETLMEKAAIGAKIPSRYAVMNTNSYLQWILTALVASHDHASYTLSFVRADEPQSDEVQEVETSETVLAPAPDEVLLGMLREKYAFSYPFADLYRVPAKLSVSRLSPDVLDETDTSCDLVAAPTVLIPDFFKTGTKARRSAAERGTATHLFLQFCDFSYAAHHGVREEFARLLEKQFLPTDAEDLIYFDELERFLAHPLLSEILEARSVIREQRFNILLAPEGFTKDKEFLSRIANERLAVQGVIDLILVDKDGRLCLYDYKTDRLSSDELADPALAGKRMNESHGLQLSYYAKAAEELFGRPCDRIAVYSTHAARLFDIVPLHSTVMIKIEKAEI